jgi:hypothetical protein
MVQWKKEFYDVLQEHLHDRTSPITQHRAQIVKKGNNHISYSLRRDVFQLVRLASTAARALSGGNRATPAAATGASGPNPSRPPPIATAKAPHPPRTRDEELVALGGEDGLGADPRRHSARCATPVPPPIPQTSRISFGFHCSSLNVFPGCLQGRRSTTSPPPGRTRSAAKVRPFGFAFPVILLKACWFTQVSFLHEIVDQYIMLWMRLLY